MMYQLYSHGKFTASSNINVDWGRVFKIVSLVIRATPTILNARNTTYSVLFYRRRLWFFCGLQYGYARPEVLGTESVDFFTVNTAIFTLSAVADHTSNGYRISSINNLSALPLIVGLIPVSSRKSERIPAM